MHAFVLFHIILFTISSSTKSAHCRHDNESLTFPYWHAIAFYSVSSTLIYWKYKKKHNNDAYKTICLFCLVEILRVNSKQMKPKIWTCDTTININNWLQTTDKTFNRRCIYCCINITCFKSRNIHVRCMVWSYRDRHTQPIIFMHTIVQLLRYSFIYSFGCLLLLRRPLPIWCRFVVKFK